MLYFGPKTNRRSGFLSTVAVVAALIGGSASAQALRDARPPAEFPPASFTGNQYVDSRGCVFVRAGIGGATEWVPRVSRTRDQLCGFQPTQVAGTTSVAPSQNVPNPLDTPVAGLPPRTAPAARPAAAAPAPVVAAARPAPAPAPRVQAPVASARVNLPTSTSGAINPLTGQPVATAQRAPVQTASPSPRVITAPAATTQARVLTRAQACAGLTGIQPNLVSQRTGQPIDCGGTTAAAPRVAAVTRPTVQQATPARLTREQACADIDATGRQYVSATTGLPIRCGPQSQRITAALSAPQRSYTNPLDATPGGVSTTVTQVMRAPSGYSNPLDSAPGTTIVPNMNTSLAGTCGGVAAGGLAIRCGPQAQSPSGGSSPATVTRARTAPSGQGFLGDLLNQNPPPYSNPTGYALQAPQTPSGYAQVWDDGRLNTQRGLPTYTPSTTYSPSGGTVRYATAPASPAPVVQNQRVQTRVAPRAEQISGHRYVQVGTFASRDQAQAIAQSLRSRGLPMRIGVFNQNGQEMRIVLAGPFGSDTQLQSALGAARSAGYSGAFTRR